MLQTLLIFQIERIFDDFLLTIKFQRVEFVFTNDIDFREFFFFSSLMQFLTTCSILSHL